MAKAVISTFSFIVQARTRDECIERMDELGLAVLEIVGGAPWVAVDDDIKKVHAAQYALSDDQGFAYQGERRYVFHGPALAGAGQALHEAFNVQYGVE